MSRLFGFRSCSARQLHSVVYGRRFTHPVQNMVAVAELDAAKGHGHPGLDVRGREHEGAVLDDILEVRVQELKHQVEILLVREDIQEL
jgi:hypothetical protein